MTTDVIRRCAAVLLDVDGVLVRTEAAVLELWDEVCLRAGRAVPGADSLGHIVGCSPEHTARHLFPGADDAQVEDVLGLVRLLEPDLRMVPVPGAARLVRELHGAGVPVALVTGASTGRLARVMRSLGLQHEVAATVTWGEARGKPHPDPYVLAAHRLGLDDAAGCVVVEDAPAGVTSAVAAGATCIGLAPPGPERLALERALAATVVGSLEELRVTSGAPARTPGDFTVRLPGNAHLSTVPHGDEPARTTRGTS